MSQELVKVTAPKALSIPPDEAAAVQEAFAINIASGTTSHQETGRLKYIRYQSSAIGTRVSTICHNARHVEDF